MYFYFINNLTKILIFFLLSALLIIHFTFVGIEGFPKKTEPKSKIQYWSFAYTYPYFHQDWRLFAPAPTQKYTLVCSFNINGIKHFSMPIDEVLERSLLFSDKEYYLLSITDACSYVSYGGTNTIGGFQKFSNDNYTAILKHALISYLKSSFSSGITDTKMFLIVTNIQTKEQTIFIE